MRVILNPLMPNKDGSLNAEYVDLCNIVGYSEEKADVKTLVEILKDLFFDKHLALIVDFDE